jgi:hypothetical protein
MNFLRRGVIALTVMATAGTGLGIAAATSASAQPPTVITTTSVQTSATFLAPNVEAFTFNEYQPSVLPPGFRLAATISELCLVGPIRSLCNWRYTSTALLHPQLRGNAIKGPSGQAGTIQGGTGIWRGARGVFRAVNIAPFTSSDTFVFTTP